MSVYWTKTTCGDSNHTLRLVFMSNESPPSMQIHPNFMKHHLAIRRIGRRSVRLSGREPRVGVRGRAAVCTFEAALAAIALGLHACGRVAGKRVS